MATKSEIRAYANRNNVSMAEAKQHFINEAKARVEAGLGLLKKHGEIKLNTNEYGHLMFDLQSEIGKFVKMITGDLPAYDIKSNRTDYDSLFGTTDGWGDAGFLIAVVPIEKQPNGFGMLAKGSSAAHRSALDNLKKQKINEDWMVVSTYITSNLAFDRYIKLFDSIHTAFIGYTTPRNLTTLSETVSICQDFAKMRQCRMIKSAVRETA